MWRDALTYLFHSQGDYRLHSPFVYDFYTKVVRGTNSPEGEAAASIRQKMLENEEALNFEDLGAGSHHTNGKAVSTQVKTLAKKASRRRQEGEFLLRLFRFCQPHRALELGTQLGISSIYQKLGWPKARLSSIEGIPRLADLAASNFKALDLDIPIYRGSFDHVLGEFLQEGEESWDYVFVDGNHQYQATIHYFERFLPHITDGGLILFDDIYWSAGMKKAWQEIIQHPEVTVSIDLFRFGLCFIRRPQAKEHFRLRSLRLLF